MKGHSERVPRKNMRQFCDRPLFHWIMDSLAECRHITEIIINTDSEELAANAEEHFAVTIHMRPDHLLTITSDEAYQIMAHDLTLTDGEYFLQTHSTTPLVKSVTLNTAIESYFAQHEHDSLLSVTEVQHRYYWPDGRAVNHDPDALIRTQELPPLLMENSCIYIFSREVFTKRKNRIGYNPLLYPVNPYEAVDIDEMIDFDIAEYLMKKQLEGQEN
ncbi:cytidylyltransferase domain-containing protein [Candidatus Neomarinimicrobiota bacterium]